MPPKRQNKRGRADEETEEELLQRKFRDGMDKARKVAQKELTVLESQQVHNFYEIIIKIMPSKYPESSLKYATARSEGKPVSEAAAAVDEAGPSVQDEELLRDCQVIQKSVQSLKGTGRSESLKMLRQKRYVPPAEIETYQREIARARGRAVVYPEGHTVLSESNGQVPEISKAFFDTEPFVVDDKLSPLAVEGAKEFGITLGKDEETGYIVAYGPAFDTLFTYYCALKLNALWDKVQANNKQKQEAKAAVIELLRPGGTLLENVSAKVTLDRAGWLEIADAAKKTIAKNAAAAAAGAGAGAIIQ